MRAVRGRGGGLRWCCCTGPAAGIHSSALSSPTRWRRAAASCGPGRRFLSPGPSRAWSGRGWRGWPGRQGRWCSWRPRRPAPPLRCSSRPARRRRGRGTNWMRPRPPGSSRRLAGRFGSFTRCCGLWSTRMPRQCSAGRCTGSWPTPASTLKSAHGISHSPPKDPMSWSPPNWRRRRWRPTCAVAATRRRNLPNSLDLTPAGAAARGRRLVHAGEFHFAAFGLEQAQQRLEEASACCEPGPGRADALWRLAKVIRYSGTAGAAADLLHRALREPGSDPGLAASIHRDLGFVLANSGQPGADEHYRAALELARHAGNRGLVAQMLGVVAFAEFASGKGLRPELIRPALRDATWTAHLPMELRPRVTISHALQYSDDLDAARSLLAEEYHAAAERGAETDLPLVLVFLVELETWAGRYDLAGQHAEQGYAAALSSGASLPLACMHGARAILRACHGEVAGARSDADAAAEIGRRGGWYVPPLWAAHARGLLQLSLGDAAGAHQAFRPVTQMLLRPGGRHVLMSRLLPDDIEAMTRLGALPDAERLLESFQATARTSQSSWARATVAQCRALVSSARGQQDAATAALSDALATHERLGMPFELGRTLLVAGQVHRRARHKLQAREHLDAAREVFERLGAPLWAERTAEELTRLGLSRARPTGLTAAERRVAELVAAGRTNREIAEELFMGQRTVEAHLARMYRKVGV